MDYSLRIMIPLYYTDSALCSISDSLTYQISNSHPISQGTGSDFKKQGSQWIKIGIGEGSDAGT